MGIKSLVQIYLGAEEMSGERADWWGLVREEDLESMRDSNLPPGPCVYCGGRLIHSKMCKMQTKGWNVMPWGKHKGVNIGEVPTSYLAFCLEHDYGAVEVKEMMLAELQRRDGMFRTLKWESYAKSTRWDQEKDQ